MIKFYIKYSQNCNKILQKFFQKKNNQVLISKFENQISNIIKNNGTFLLCGNGGSFADALHISAELSGKFINFNRKPLKSICLGANSGSLTAIANDFDYTEIFSREIRPYLIDENYLLIIFSTSGKSKNILKDLKEKNLDPHKVFIFTGKKIDLKNYNIFKFDTTITSHIQECYKIFFHSVLTKLNL